MDEPQEKIKNKGGRPKGSKNKPKKLTKKSVKDKTLTRRSVRTPLAREEIDSIERKRVLSHEKHPWDEILNSFLTPNMNEDGTATWLTLGELGERFNIPYPTVKARSGKYNWIQQQNETERAYYAAAHEKALRAMANQLPIVQNKAFDNCKKTVHHVASALEGRKRMASSEEIVEVKDLIAINKASLETVFTAAGVANAKLPAPSSDLFAMRLSQKEEKLVMGPDGKYVEASKKQTLLEMFQSRVVGQTGEET
jgi:hypothetical protein